MKVGDIVDYMTYGYALPILFCSIFEVPEGWAWVRLATVLSLSSGKSIKVRQLTDEGEFPVYGGNGINGTYSDYNVDSDTIIIGRVGFYCGSNRRSYSPQCHLPSYPLPHRLESLILRTCPNPSMLRCLGRLMMS